MTDSRRTFLGVDRSVGGRRWVHALDPRAEAAAARMAQLSGLPDIVSRVMAARGVAPEAAEAFLAPTIRDLMPDPSTLTDMDAAAARLADAIERRETAAVFGDYDVDGAASAALMHRYFAHFGLRCEIRIPDRITEGYGPNAAALKDLADRGATLIVTVDCGSTSRDALVAAAEQGTDIVVLDHHQVGADLPPAVALVNPNRQDDLSAQGHLCAAGVVFLTLVAVSRELRRRGHATSSLPDLLNDLDLVALATVCDVVPLVGFNRALVVRGLEILRARRNPGLRALAETARLQGPVEAFHLGFLLGPRINAGGRIGDAALGSRLLTLRSESEAKEIAEELELLNAERQAMEREMLAEAEAEIRAEIGEGDGPPILVAGRSTWHPGIVGLIAARLKERFGRPAFAIAFDAAGRGTGSGRSIAGFDIGRFVRDAVADGTLLRGGGHAMAAGLTIERDSLADFRLRAETRARSVVDTLRAADSLALDGAIGARGLTVDMVRTIERAGPFGSGHPAPVFALPRHRLVSSAPVGSGGHVRATLRGADGATAPAIAFRAAGTPIGDVLLGRRGEDVHVAGSVSIDRYQGSEKVTFRIVDVALPAI
ncbi:single-stranded-DNA-specific exonuclease RecJ [Aureimonas flava]|uniref:Single-stranded-DNA-specific exonuclease RecJ n=1 Tax=Aureimonas flava TaxID=2320271 RepID=A0A3A1WRE9_9HYPH|nr:single-stranded-DNA-specific exonuclease RecJ [Aureimonas flava]RIY03653.1 single-stranded-DNA-specific exonuclease RecJ [Aureimonas flava]